MTVSFEYNRRTRSQAADGQLTEAEALCELGGGVGGVLSGRDGRRSVSPKRDATDSNSKTHTQANSRYCMGRERWVSCCSPTETGSGLDGGLRYEAGHARLYEQVIRAEISRCNLYTIKWNDSNAVRTEAHEDHPVDEFRAGQPD